MHLNEHEGVLVYNPSNMFYLSGYTGEGLVLITHKTLAIVTDFRYTEQAENQAPGYQVHMISTGRNHEAIAGELCREAGYTVVEEYGGHGIGREFHEDPFVSFVSERGTGPILVPGMCFTIEPMVNAGAPDITTDKDNGWIVRTADGSDSAQWEVQLVVTEDGYELLSW